MSRAPRCTWQSSFQALSLFTSHTKFHYRCKNRHYTNYSRESGPHLRDPVASTPNWIAFRVTKNEGIGASHDFTGKNPFAFALLDS